MASSTAQSTSSLTDINPADLATETLEAEIVRFASHIAAAICRWLLLIAEFDRRAGYESWDMINTASWLSWQCGIDPVTAREQVRVARSLGELPKITAAFSEGRLSYSKVRAITRVATPDNEQTLIDLALYATAAQVEKVVANCRRWLCSEDPDASELHKKRFLRYTDQADGTVMVVARLTQEDAALVRRAIDSTKGRITPKKGADRSDEQAPGEVDDTWSALNADALVAMSKAMLTTKASPGHSAAHHVVVHVDESALANGREHGELEGGRGVMPETLRRICCDTKIQAITYDSDGKPAGLGRSQRTAPPWLKRALLRRDKGCRFPNCDHDWDLDAHHIIHWLDHGPTELDNLVLLCGFHHRLVHDMGYELSMDKDGSLTVESQKPRKERVPEERGTWDLAQALGIAVKEEAVFTECTGQVMDLGYVVSMIGLDGPISNN